MNDNPEFATVDDSTQPGKLRQLYEQALAALKQKDQEIADLRTAETQRTVQATWDELKVPDFVRGMYHGDKSPDAIKAWWENSKGFFNIEALEEKSDVQPEQTPAQAAAEAAARSFEAASSVGADILSPGLEAVNAKVQAAKGLKGADFAAAKAEIYQQLGFSEY